MPDHDRLGGPVGGKSRPRPLKVASQSGEAVRSSVGRFHGESAGADAGVADHDESACGEIVDDLLEIREDDCRERSGLLVGAPEQYDTRRQDRRIGQKLTEIGIGGYQDPVSRSATAMICSSGWPPRPSCRHACSRDLRRAAAPPSRLAGTRRSGISRGEPDRKLAFIDRPRCIAQAGLHVGGR